MPLLACTGTGLMCTFGMAPGVLNVLPGQVTGPTPMATVLDHKPMVNIPPFGMCSAPSNPQVAAATAAALGVLTPQPCVPATSTPWIPTNPTLTAGPAPALTNASKLMCQWGGMITITQPGQVTISD